MLRMGLFANDEVDEVEARYGLPCTDLTRPASQATQFDLCETMWWLLPAGIWDFQSLSFDCNNLIVMILNYWWIVMINWINNWLI